MRSSAGLLHGPTHMGSPVCYPAVAPAAPQVERGLARGTSLEAFKLLLNIILLQVGGWALDLVVP
jgi:hypothetical protein